MERPADVSWTTPILWHIVGGAMAASLGNGVYAFKDAARLTGLRPSRVREWFRGRGRTAKPVLAGDYAPVDGDFAISFHDLIDVFVVGQLRDHGISLQTVRKVFRRMQVSLGVEHPFCRKELLTDGKTVFTQNVDPAGREHLIEVLTGQGVFPQIILPFLKKIDYDKVRLLARRWRIADAVVIDPGICYGAPVIEAVGMPTAILADAYRANGNDAHVVCEWYNVKKADVLAAVSFEKIPNSLPI
jgi:uncharacterized protein (DUF433 family)